jgi:hypothetical protein
MLRESVLMSEAGLPPRRIVFAVGLRILLSGFIGMAFFKTWLGALLS